MGLKVELSNKNLDTIFKELIKLDGFNPSDDKPKFNSVRVMIEEVEVLTQVKCEFKRDIMLCTMDFQVELDASVDAEVIGIEKDDEYFSKISMGLEYCVDELAYNYLTREEDVKLQE